MVVETEQGGKAASQDVGLPYVTGDVVVCIDADMIIDVDVVERFVAELEAGADATSAEAECRPSIPRASIGSSSAANPKHPKAAQPL